MGEKETVFDRQCKLSVEQFNEFPEWWKKKFSREMEDNNIGGEEEDGVVIMDKQLTNTLEANLLDLAINTFFSPIASVHTIYIKTTEYGYKLFIVHYLSDIEDVFKQIQPATKQLNDKFNNIYFSCSYIHVDEADKIITSKHLTQANLIYTSQY